jgi:hypothetical protein
MSYSYEPLDNINNKYYHVFDKQPHYRKGKIMNKHKQNQAYSDYKIDLYKKKNNIEPTVRVSLYDIYKSQSNNKRARLYTKFVRSKGYDYKIFAAINENLIDQNDSLNQNKYDDDLDDYYDDYDNYSERYDDYSYRRDYYSDRWDY